MWHWYTLEISMHVAITCFLPVCCNGTCSSRSIWRCRRPSLALRTAGRQTGHCGGKELLYFRTIHQSLKGSEKSPGNTPSIFWLSHTLVWMTIRLDSDAKHRLFVCYSARYWNQGLGLSNLQPVTHPPRNSECDVRSQHWQINQIWRLVKACSTQDVMKNHSWGFACEIVMN